MNDYDKIYIRFILTLHQHGFIDRHDCIMILQRYNFHYVAEMMEHILLDKAIEEIESEIEALDEEALE